MLFRAGDRVFFVHYGIIKILEQNLGRSGHVRVVESRDLIKM